MDKLKGISIFVVIIAVLVIIGISLIKYFEISSFERELSKSINYGGTIIINLDKDTSKSNVCVYFKDMAYNSSSDLSKTPIKMMIFSIDEKSKLKVIKKENWTRDKYGKLNGEIIDLDKYNENNDNLMKIRDYEDDCYVSIEKIKNIANEYDINL